MAYDFTNNLIPVLTVSSDDYLHPSKNKDGQWVVSASVVNKDPNKYVLFNPTTRIYTTVAPNTVSPDYYKQIRDSEARIAEQMKGWADAANPNQINSLADVATINGGEGASILFTPKWWSQQMDMWKALGEYTKEYALDPLLKDADPNKEGWQFFSSNKGSQLLNNSLINLSETIDIVTGANAVKGLIMEGTEGLKKGMNWDGTGRVQYDWNVNTGGGFGDTVANFTLELVSDPTNWITFGASGAIKATGKEALSGAILKSVDDIGLTGSKAIADDMADAILRTYIHKPGTLAQSAGKAKIGQYVQQLITVNQADAFTSALKNNINLMSETKNMDLLKSVRTGLDTSQEVAAKAVGLTSALGWGIGTAKLTAKLGRAGIPLLARTLNSAMNDTNLNNMTYKNYASQIKDVGLKVDNLKQITKLPSTYPTEVVQILTHNYQEVEYQKLRSILFSNDSTEKIYKEFNQAVQKHGFADGRAFFEQMQRTDSVVPDELRSQLSELGNKYSRLYDSMVSDYVSKVHDFIKEDRILDLHLDEVTSLITNLKAIAQLGITPNIAAAQYNTLARHLYELLTLHLDMRSAMTKYSSLNLNAFRYNTVFKYTVLENNKFVNIPAEQISKYMQQGIVFPTIPQGVLNKFKMELSVLDTALADTPTLQELIGNEVNTIRTALSAWEIAPELFTLDDATSANAALVAIQRKLKNTHGILTAQASIDINKMTPALLESASSLGSQLSSFIENYRNTFSHEPKANVFTDTIITNAAKGVTDNTVKDLINHIAEQKGIPGDAVKKLFVQLTNFNPDLAYHNKHNPAIKAAHRSLRILRQELEHMKTTSYFIDELGLDEVLKDWVDNGFSFDLGNRLVRSLDDAVNHITRGRFTDDEVKPMAVTDTTAIKIQNVRDEVQSLIDNLSETETQRVKATAEYISGKLYEAKLADVQALSWILSNDKLQQALAEIKQSSGSLGKLFEVLADETGQSPAAHAINTIRGLAKSTYVANRAFELIRDSNLPSDITDGLYDTLAGEIKKHISELHTPEYVAAEWLNSAKEYVDSIRNVHSPRLHELTYSGNPAEAANELYHALFDPRNADENNYWTPVRDELLKNKAYNIVYSASATGYQTGTIFEAAFILPDKTRIKFIDKSMFDTFKRTIDESTARSVYGKSKAQVIKDMEERILQDASNPNVKILNNTEEFAIALYDLFKRIKDTAREQGVVPRLVGFNNAMDSLATDKILARFLDNNKTNTHIVYNNVEYKSMMTIRSFDAAQWLRINYEKAIPITDSMHSEVTEIVRGVKDYLDRANIRVTDGKATVMPDFNTDVTTSFRELLAALDNTIAIKESSDPRTMRELMSDLDDEVTLDAEQRIVANKQNRVFKDITKEQYQVLNLAYTVEELRELRGYIANTLQDVGDTLSSIKATNNRLRQYIIIQENLPKLLGERNVMNILYKYARGENGMLMFSYKRVFNPAAFNEWFDDGYLKTFAGVEDLATYTKLNDIAERLQRQRSLITHPLLIMDIPNSVIQDVINILRSEFIKVPNYKYSEWAKEVLMLRTDGNPINNFLIAKLYYDSIVKVSNVDTINQVFAKAYSSAGQHSALLMEYIKIPNESVFYKEPLYVPGLQVLHSRLIEASNYIMQLTKELNTVLSDTRKMETLDDMLTLQLKLKEELGINLPSLEAKQRHLLVYRKLIDRVQYELKAASIWYQSHAGNTEDERMLHQRLYTDRVKQILAQLEDIGIDRATTRTRYVLSLQPQDYATYLYKYSQGVQVIDLASDVIAQSPQALTNFMTVLKQAAQYGVRYQEDLTKHELYVYLDKTADLNTLEELAKRFALAPKQTKLEGAIGGLYNEFSDLMDKQFDGTYSLSMHRIMDSSKYKELLSYLPASVRDNIIPEGYLHEHDLIEGVFMQSVLGDYNSGVGSIFKTHSGNVVTNIAAGFNVAFNRLHGKDLYTSMFFNYDNSLLNWMSMLEATGKTVTHQDVLTALKNNGYVVATLVNGRVQKLSIQTYKQFEYARHYGAVLLDYQTYTRAVEVINDNTISGKTITGKMYHWLNKNYFYALKSGMLLSPGFLARNVLDSTIKGWIQSGFDPSFIAQMVETKRLMAQYDNLYSAIFIANKSDMSHEAVNKYLRENMGTLSMNPEIFRGMFTFFNNSASVPTPVQMNLSTDLIKKLHLRVQAAGITVDEVEDAVKTFKETMKEPNAYSVSKQTLLAKYPEDKAELLMTLRKYVPKEELKAPWFEQMVKHIPPLQGLIDSNNAFERFIRMHVFLYHSVYTTGSYADATKMVDLSQFNRKRDPRYKHWIEMFLPFSSFQMDNATFWTSALGHNRNNLIALTEDALNGAYDEEQIDAEELSRNMSLQYLYMSGNLILDDEEGTVLKLNDSLHNTLQLFANPIQTFANMINVPTDVMLQLVTGKFEDMKPEEYNAELLQLIPLVGVLYQRHNAAWDKASISDAIASLALPSLFGTAKLDSNIPVGYNWYEQPEEYRKTHRYVFGVSYVPAWMKSDPNTYVNTFQRLLNMGYSEAVAGQMMQTGWYIKAPTYQLKHYTPYVKKTYVPKSRPHYNYSRTPKKMRKVYFKRNRAQTYSADRIKLNRYGYTRAYKTRLYSDLYTRTGVPRETLIHWRGANRSSRQLLIDRSNARKMRTKRIIRQVLGR